jgi:hypothetical protein
MFEGIQEGIYRPQTQLSFLPLSLVVILLGFGRKDRNYNLFLSYLIMPSGMLCCAPTPISCTANPAKFSVVAPICSGPVTLEMHGKVYGLQEKFDTVISPGA